MPVSLPELLAQLPCGVAILNSAGKLIHANPIAEQWLADSPSDALRNMLAIWCRTGPPEEPLRMGRVDLQVRIAALEATGGQAAWIALLHDVTLLAERDRRHVRFVSDAAHELRNPITALTLSASVMDRIPKEDWPDQVRSFIRHTDYLSQIIHDLLEVSRLESGHVELEWHQILLDAFLSDVIAGHQAAAQEHDLSLQMELCGALPSILGDPKRLRQTLDHLLANAVAFTPSGGRIQVQVFVTSREDRNWVGVRVADTGIGIEETALDHIFEPFYRTDSARRSGPWGAGLGLTIVRGLVELHGGSISVESTPGVGSAFTLLFPPAP